jgi:hypothetical protein
MKENKRKKIFEYTLENDMNYIGPLNIRLLRVVGWVFILLSAIGSTMSLLHLMTKSGYHNTPEIVFSILSIFSKCAIPIFVIARFSYVLQRRDDFHKLLAFYALFIFGIAFAFLANYYYYLLNLGKAFFFQTYKETATLFKSAILSYVYKGKSLNVFVDLFLYTSFAYFMLYVPKNHFKGNKLIYFRLFALFPVLYHILMVLIKFLSIYGVFEFPVPLFPFLPTNSIITFIAFVFVVIFMKRRKRIYQKYSENDYEEFKQTKAYSWYFSKSLALIFLIFGLIDIFIFLILEIPSNAAAENPDLVTNLTNIKNSIGVGEGFSMILIIPIILLFSSTKKHKPQTVDYFMPIVAIGVIAFAIFNIVFFDIVYHIMK